MRKLLAASVLAALAATIFNANSPAGAAELKAEVMHWWTSGGESAAVKVFAEQFSKAGGVWIDSAVADGATARAAEVNRVIGGKPPTAMQFNTGAQFDDLVTNGLLRDVDAIAAAGNWRKIMPSAIMDAVTRGGKIYAVPVNIHAGNWLWYNKAVFEKAGATVPTTLDELFTALDRIKATGAIPFAFAGQKWVETLTFNALLAALDHDVYVNLLTKRDPALVRSKEFRAAADAFIKLRGYVDPSSPGRNWNDATAMVITGKAGMQIMGDWAKGEFGAAGLTPGKEYGCAVVGQSYVMGGDVFLFPKIDDPSQVAAQDLLAKTMIEPETQIKFNAKKGSVPIRTDIDVSSMDICAQAGAKLLADPKRQAPDISLVVPASVVGAIDDVVSQFWNTPAMPVDDFIAKYSAALKSDL
jgi:glucose/mannose transport system substrate-binding protein